ncbi:MAG: ABC transporter ATP-binding protein [Verrucomicrobiota bacterium]
MIQARKLTRRYRSAPGEQPLTALDHVSLEIQRGAFVAVRGASGSGKSTLMHLLGGLDTASDGELVVDGVPLHKASEKELTRFRRERVGFIFQFFNLLPGMSVTENVGLPLRLAGVSAGQSDRKAEAVLERVGLSERRRHRLHQLSGGEIQRAAVARALVHEPRLLLADEPTGNLDSDNAERVLALFQELHAAGDLTVVFVTHSRDIAERAEREIRMKDGRLAAPTESLSRSPAGV